MNQIDVVYKLGTGSRHNNTELKYSLRSLRNFLPLRKIYIIGYLPEWVQNVYFIPSGDPLLTNKDGNLINKLILASTHEEITEEFINMSDDQLFLKPCSYDDIKIPYIENKHISPPVDKRLNRWERRLQRTIEELKNKNYSTDCYESHAPCLINKNEYPKILRQYPYEVGQGLCGNTLYYNSLGVKGQLANDSIYRLYDTIERKAFLDICHRSKFLNYTDDLVGDVFLSYLNDLFPEKSIYEK